MITNQAYTFIIFVIIGFLIGIIFDFFRILRKSIKTNDIVTYFQDITFCIITGFIVLYAIFYFNNGEFRIYLFIGILLGCLMYLVTISHYIIKINVIILTKIINLCKKIIIIIQIPFKKICKIIRKLLNPIIFIIINTSKNMSKKEKSNKKIHKILKIKRIFEKKVE